MGKVDTKQKILHSAFSLFTKQGYAATSMSMIAKSAKVTQSLIHHHFQDKKKLWLAIKEEYVAQKYPKLILEFDHFKTIKEALDDYITMRFNFYLDNPQMTRMISWQRLEDTPHKLASPSAKEGKASLVKFIETQQKKGKLSKKIDAKSFVMFLHPAISAVILDNYIELKRDSRLRTKLLSNIKETLVKGLLNFEE